ncbi:MAG: sodium:proton antiporter [Bdellovibrionales bacterium]
MTIFQTIALLLILAAAGAYFNRRVFKLPATIGIMVFAQLLSLAAIGLNGMGLIDLHHVSEFVARIDFPNVMLHGLLSFLLFAGALRVDFAELKKNKVTVIVLATVSVALSMLIVSALIWLAALWLGHALPYAHAMLFGALIAPTDPVAVLSTLKETTLTKSLRIKIGCESLLNDGMGVVLFLLILGIAMQPETHSVNAPQVLIMGIGSVCGGIALGLASGWLACSLINSIDDYNIEVLLTLALAAGSYALAEALYVSAPVTVVVAGLVIGNHGRMFNMADKTRNYLDTFWELLDQTVNAILFMLIGMQMIVIPVDELSVTLGLIAIPVVLLARYISVALPIMAMSLRSKFEPGTLTLLTWGGLRGGISIAMALSLPAGHEKNLLLGMTYIVVVFSILVQGTTFRRVANGTAKP